MSVEKREMFTVICDNCGESADEGTDYSCWVDSDQAKEMAMESGFISEGYFHYCPKCFEYDDNDQLVINKERAKKWENKDLFDKAVIAFRVFDIDYNFTVYHNLAKLGLHIEAALENWVYRTKEFTEESFCEYVMSKDDVVICMGEEQYNRLFK